MKLQTKLVVLITSLLLVVIVGIGIIFQQMWAATMKEQVGTRALRLAETIASMSEIQRAFQDPDPAKTIQPLIEGLRMKTGAEFIVVGNKEGIRYSHPVPERIGQQMVGGDNGPVLEGHSIISEAVGTLGPSLRGKAPIVDDHETVIGVVSVGFLLEDIQAAAVSYRNRIIGIGFLALVVGALGAVLISRNVKRSIWGLEPAEIGTLYQEKMAILESIREGILAVDIEGRITLANRYALKMLGVPEGHDITGTLIGDLLPNSRLPDVIRSGVGEFDREMAFHEEIVIVNRIPIIDRQGRVAGAVSSFRNRSDLYRLTEELAQTKRYAEALRAQTHEYNNKLYLISGLLQLESYQEAIEMITRESVVHQDLIHFIMSEVPDPIIGGLLIGKFNRANERKVHLEIDRQSSFLNLPEVIDRHLLVTIIGNLIDNALDAVMDVQEKMVIVFLTDLGEDLIIEVEDSGTGIPEAQLSRVFESGYSTKGSHRGVGLSLVDQALKQLGGYMTYSGSELGGAHWTVSIPKRQPFHMRGGDES